MTLCSADLSSHACTCVHTISVPRPRRYACSVHCTLGGRHTPTMSGCCRTDCLHGVLGTVGFWVTQGALTGIQGDLFPSPDMQHRVCRAHVCAMMRNRAAFQSREGAAISLLVGAEAHTYLAVGEWCMPHG